MKVMQYSLAAMSPSDIMVTVQIGVPILNGTFDERRRCSERKARSLVSEVLASHRKRI